MLVAVGVLAGVLVSASPPALKGFETATLSTDATESDLSASPPALKGFET